MSVYEFEMEMCCDMQVGCLIRELELCKQAGNTKGRVVHPRYPAAPSRDTLFDSMNLYARLDDDGKVELAREGTDDETEDNGNDQFGQQAELFLLCRSGHGRIPLFS